MYKTLIVGGAGYIGGYLTDTLKNGNYDVTVYDNLTYESRYLKDVKFINGDIRDTNKLSNIVNDYDCIIWLAAIVGDGACAIDPSLTRDINFKSVKWLVDNYKGKIVFTSTCSVYGVNHDLITEDAEPNPLSVYAETKLEAEQYIVNNHDNYFIFRLGTLFGMGDMFSRIRLDLVSNILTLKAVKGETLSVFGGEQWRPLLHVKDVSTGIKHILDNSVNGLYNISSRNYTIKQIAEEIGDVVGGVNIEYTDMSFEDLRNYKVSSDKFLDTHWIPRFNMRDGILEIKKVIEDNRIVDVNDIVYSNVAYIRRNISEII